jgi:hypothetical protein
MYAQFNLLVVAGVSVVYWFGLVNEVKDGIVFPFYQYYLVKITPSSTPPFRQKIHLPLNLDQKP